MKLQELQAANQATLDALRENPGEVPNVANLHPFFGYYEVDIFECPPFIMFTGNDCPRGWNILFAKSFEPVSMKLWCRLVRQATGVLDIGSHVGVYSLAAAALRQDLTIHAFEPNPYAFARLRMHKLVNRFWNIEEHTVAVGHRNEYVPFTWVKKPTLQISSGGGVGGRKRTDIEKTVAKMVTLDGSGIAPTLGSRPVVKIDVEGGEILTFLGMQEVLALKPDIILETFSQDACDAVNAMIEPLGYHVYHILEKADQIQRQNKLMPCSVTSGDFNQLLTTRAPDEVTAIIDPR